jgi:glycosyltransferase involved in cell wall biosynthesis
MRVAFYGNVCNTHYQLAVALRAHSDIDAHVFVDAKSHPQMMPESDTPSLRGKYPDWIHTAEYYPRFDRLFPWRSRLQRELAEFDVNVVSSNGPMFAQFSGRPTCFLVTGSDLVEMPFPLMYFSRYPGVRMKLDALLCGVWQRRAIRRLTEIWSQPFLPFEDSLRRIGARPDQVQGVYLPVAIDAEEMTQTETMPDTVHVRAMRRDFDFVVFHPSRIMIRGDKRLPPAHAAALVKRNDVLVRGFARFIQQTKANAALAVIDREASPDRDLARSLAQDLGISDHLVWLRPPTPDGFTRADLRPLYAAADAVADDFGVGWFGSVVLEGCAAGKPVVSYIDEEIMRTLYPWHPIVNAKTDEDVALRLRELFESREKRKEIGRRGRVWIDEFHSGRRLARLYFEQFRALAVRLGIPPPTWTAPEM